MVGCVVTSWLKEAGQCRAGIGGRGCMEGIGGQGMGWKQGRGGDWRAGLGDNSEQSRLHYLELASGNPNCILVG